MNTLKVQGELINIDKITRIEISHQAIDRITYEDLKGDCNTQNEPQSVRIFYYKKESNDITCRLIFNSISHPMIVKETISNIKKINGIEKILCKHNCLRVPIFPSPFSLYELEYYEFNDNTMFMISEDWADEGYFVVSGFEIKDGLYIITNTDMMLTEEEANNKIQEKIVEKKHQPIKIIKKDRTELKSNLNLDLDSSIPF